MPPASTLRGRPRWRRVPGGDRRVVRLLDEDLEIALRVPEPEREVARRTLVVSVEQLRAGTWAPPGRGEHAPLLGYLLLGGAVLRESRVESQWTTEVLGPGDVLRPWEEDDEIVGDVSWRILETTNAAAVGHSFVIRSARWPGVFDELLARTVRRTRMLATLRSIGSIRRLDERLLVLLRLLAGRWGRVSPLGVHVGLPLTHETLARLASAQRPSVSASIARLRRDGAVLTMGREFVLTAEPDHDGRRTA
jgi:CRP/FNR family cyclic AMP-dependent transcriptional regulator